jgi:hypothetical protein
MYTYLYTHIYIYSWNGTALHTAAEWGRADVCKILINAGANLEARDCDLKTPPHMTYMYPPPHVTCTYPPPLMTLAGT